MRELLAQPRPERFASLVFKPESPGGYAAKRELAVGLGITTHTLDGVKIKPTAEIYLLLDDQEFALPANFVRGLMPRLQELADAADALNKENTHG